MNDQAQIVRSEGNARTLAMAWNLADAVNEWQEHLALLVSAGSISQDTANSYRRGMDKFTGWLEGRTPDGDVILEWMADLKAQGRKPGAVNAWLGGVRSFFGWATTKAEIPFNPAQGIRGAERKGTTKRHKRESLTDEEVRRLLAQPDLATPDGIRDYALLAVQLYTAARGIELHRADVADLKTQGGLLVLFVQGKGHEEKDEPVILLNNAETAVREWLSVRGSQPGALFTSLSDRSRGERLSRRALREIVTGYFKAAGIVGNKTTHSLRHTAITKALQNGVSITRVSKQLARHASIDTTMIYVHEADRLNDPVEEHISYD